MCSLLCKDKIVHELLHIFQGCGTHSLPMIGWRLGCFIGLRGATVSCQWDPGVSGDSMKGRGLRNPGGGGGIEVVCWQCCHDDGRLQGCSRLLYNHWLDLQWSLSLSKMWGVTHTSPLGAPGAPPATRGGSPGRLGTATASLRTMARETRLTRIKASARSYLLKKTGP